MTSGTYERWADNYKFLEDALCYPDEEIIHDKIVYRMIPGEDHYFASSCGEIIGVFNGKVTRLKTWKNQYGHEYVSLYRGDGTRRKASVHRLVAVTFLDNYKNYPVVRHLDDDPSDNDVNNLAWGTQADNVQDCRNHGRMYTRPVYCCELNKRYNSCLDAANDLNVRKSAITLCCRGKIKTVNGLHLYYSDEYKEGKSYGRDCD